MCCGVFSTLSSTLQLMYKVYFWAIAAKKLQHIESRQFTGPTIYLFSHSQTMIWWWLLLLFWCALRTMWPGTSVIRFIFVLIVYMRVRFSLIFSCSLCLYAHRRINANAHLFNSLAQWSFVIDVAVIVGTIHFVYLSV